MLRPGRAGSNTSSDHIGLLDAAIAALRPKHRRRLLVIVDGAGASHGLVEHLHELAERPGRQLVYSVGWEMAGRERAALAQTPEQACRSPSMRPGAAGPSTAAPRTVAGIAAAGSPKRRWPS